MDELMVASEMKPIYNLISILMDWLSVEVGVDEEWF